ncbi:MAG TPA: MFS transporter [Polyangiaceae bacterium]|nr:MFS transporter [Polyangiaceae bacterium]
MSLRVSHPTPRRSWIVWGVTWLSYATYYFGRKNLSVTKASIGRALGSHALYGVETAYLAAYAIGQYGSGWLGDRVGARKLVGVGMLVAAVASFAFGLWSVGALFLATAVVNGFAQSTGWPGNVKAMQEWTTPEKRGRVMGVWATCYQVGGIAATAFAASMLARGGWRAAYFGPAVVIAVVAVLVLALVPSKGPAAEPTAPTAGGHGEAERDRAARRAVALSATVWWYGASYFFIKLIRYSLLFWLPFYLETVLQYAPAQAGYFSTSFEIGGVVGTIALGALSDRLPGVSRSVVCATSLVGLAVALFVYTQVGGIGHATNFAAMALVGALLYGPDSLLSGAAAQDLGGPRAAALAIGMINGLGSVGAVSQEFITRAVSRSSGWNAVFYVLLVSAAAAAALLVPTFRTAPRTAASPVV